MCVRERERVCVCVCVKERECVCVCVCTELISGDRVHGLWLLQREHKHLCGFVINTCVALP